MQQNRLFEELSGKISALLAQSPAKDAEKNLRALLASFFARLDLVDGYGKGIYSIIIMEFNRRADDEETD